MKAAASPPNVSLRMMQRMIQRLSAEMGFVNASTTSLLIPIKIVAFVLDRIVRKISPAQLVDFVIIFLFLESSESTSPLKVVTLMLIASAVVITGSALKDAYYP